ncbi:hypothetical protein AVEN_220551-1 [Araneus ventricosus]|uniref:Uncharacterized protein n=1 Tax=Araneus ventricosus TaxID=182803 RepID=A0A4Y2W2Q0_ARAVE|nr:hypothetical protein AVEN_220551-1 [Araneus ventricosus]
MARMSPEPAPMTSDFHATPATGRWSLKARYIVHQATHGSSSIEFEIETIILQPPKLRTYMERNPATVSPCYVVYQVPVRLTISKFDIEMMFILSIFINF